MTSTRFKLRSAAHLFLIRDGHILLARRYKTGYEDGNYSVVAGHLDGGEEVKSAMIREAWEEAGIEIAPEDLQVIGVMHRRTESREYVDFFLTARAWNGTLEIREPDKCDELTWFLLDRLPENVVPYVRQAIENYRQGIWFDSFGWS